MASIVPAPDLTENKPASDRSSGNNDCPKVPDFRPSGLRTLGQCLSMIMARCGHFRFRDPSERAICGPSIAAERSSSSTCWRSRFSSRNRFARSVGDTAGLGARSFDPRGTFEVIIWKSPLPLRWSNKAAERIMIARRLCWGTARRWAMSGESTISGLQDAAMKPIR